MTDPGTPKKSRSSMGLGKITEQDEFKHVWRKYQEFHNESWYFNAIDFPAKTHVITRVGYRMGANELEIMFLAILDKNDESKNLMYFNRIPVKDYPEDNVYGDAKVKYQCLEPMKKWRLTFKDERFEADLLFDQRFPPYIYMSQEDPTEALKKYGMEILKIAAQRHYEQGMNVKGSIKLKEKGRIKEERHLNCYGHRDHSWGTRNWVLIDGWNWVACQFEDCTMNFSRVWAFGKIIEHGFISTRTGSERVLTVEVETQKGFEGNTSVPKTSTFKITTPTRKLTIVSKTWKSIYLARQMEQGSTEVYEQIVHFEMDGRQGYGISEYMASQKK